MGSQALQLVADIYAWPGPETTTPLKCRRPLSFPLLAAAAAVVSYVLHFFVQGHRTAIGGREVPRLLLRLQVSHFQHDFRVRVPSRMFFGPCHPLVLLVPREDSGSRSHWKKK